MTYEILDRYSHLASLSREAAVQRGVKLAARLHSPYIAYHV